MACQRQRPNQWHYPAGSPNRAERYGSIRFGYSPKTIVVTGGDVSARSLSMEWDTGSTGGAFKLGISETIAVTYGALQQTTAIFAE